MTVQAQDPFAAAMAAKPREPVYWGNLQTDAYFVILEKGIGRVPYQEGVHPPERKVTAVDLSLLCISEQNIQNPIERSVIAEFGEWTRFILPSLKDLGVELRDLNDKFVKIKVVPTGRKYPVKDAEGNPTGEQRDATTFKFLQVFADENECVSDYLSGIEEAPEEESIPGFDSEVQPAPQPQAGGNGDSAEKQTAKKFLEVLVNNAVNGQEDLTVIQNTLAASLENTPLVSKHFQVDSPETLELILAATGS